MLLEGAAGEAKETGCFGRPQKAWRQAGQWIGHDRTSVVLAAAAKQRRESKATMAKKQGVGGW